jgi:hypothetical protein
MRAAARSVPRRDDDTMADILARLAAVKAALARIVTLLEAEVHE